MAAVGPPVQAYVTLDRDVLKPHYNQYPDGPFPAVSGLAGVMDCLTHLHGQGVPLIGFDITGLPVIPSSSHPQLLDRCRDPSPPGR